MNTMSQLEEELKTTETGRVFLEVSEPRVKKEELSQSLQDLEQSLISFGYALNDALDEIIRKLQESLPTYQMLTELYYVRTPEEIKKQIKHEKNPMRLKQLNRELNESYKVYRKKK